MAKRQKRRTSIRTASGTLQDRLLVRWKELQDDPFRVLPDCPDGEPKAVAKVRARIERMAAGKTTFFDRRDKGIIGAVAHALPLADLEAVPRVADHKIGGKRRFYLQRGHVERTASLGVQNHHEPLVLIWAWNRLAKDGLHFFAGSRLWCSERPVPPEDWWRDLGEALELDLQEEADGLWGDGHTQKDRALLRFWDGSALAVAPRKGHAAYARLTERYRGPRQRQPVEVKILRADGSEVEPDREKVAEYRAGLLDDRALVKLV